MVSFNGTVYFRDAAKVVLHSDACDVGGGVFIGGKWRYFNWTVDFPQVKDLHINNKEVVAALLGVSVFAPSFQGKDVLIVTDSTVAKAVLNKGRSRSCFVNDLLRELFWLTESFGIRIRAVHCPGALNQLPDSISRLHENGQSS